jgi:hypothetical protein
VHIECEHRPSAGDAMCAILNSAWPFDRLQSATLGASNALVVRPKASQPPLGGSKDVAAHGAHRLPDPLAWRAISNRSSRP